MTKIALSDAYSDQPFRTIRVLGTELWWPLPIVRDTSSSSAIVLGWRVYGADAPRIIQGLHRLALRCNRAKWRLFHRYHPKHRYHVVDTGLPPGYYDEDTLVLHSCMKMLERYVQQNGGVAHLESFSNDLREDARNGPSAPEDSLERQASMQDEAAAIYRWWKQTRPADEARCDALTEHLYGGGKRRLQFKDAEDAPGYVELVPAPMSSDDEALREELWGLKDKIADDEQSMLHRLIDIRPGLWT